MGLVKIGAAEEVATLPADEFAAALLKTGGAGGAEDGVVFGRVEGTLGGGVFHGGFGYSRLHWDSVAQFANFSTSISCRGRLGRIE